MIEIKKYESFVNEQIEDFYGDYEDSQKRIKLFTSFTKSKLSHEKKDIKVNEPKKKFQPKIRVAKRINNDKGIF
jgi:hypothetical protein